MENNFEKFNDDPRKKIEYFKNYPQDWDTYGSGPASDELIKLGLSILDIFEDNDFVCEWVCYTSDQSILFEFSDDPKLLSIHHKLIKIEVDEDGDIGVMINDLVLREIRYYGTVVEELDGFLKSHKVGNENKDF